MLLEPPFRRISFGFFFFFFFFCCVRLHIVKRLTIGSPDVVCVNNSTLLITNRGSIGAVVNDFRLKRSLKAELFQINVSLLLSLCLLICPG